jgi:hypothetical protein
LGLLSTTLRSMQRRKARETSPPSAPMRRGEAVSTRVNPPTAVPPALPPAEPRKETPRELPRLGVEARYIYDERVGIGLDLGMPLERAEDVALVEALLAEGVVPHHLRPIATAVVDAWGPWETDSIGVVSIEEWMSTGVSVGDIQHAVTLAGAYRAASGPTKTTKNDGGGRGKETKETSP